MTLELTKATSSDSVTGETYSYATLAEAEIYLAARYDPDALWSGATDAVKLQLLATATREIDRCFFVGYRTNSDQPHRFPRDGDTTIPIEAMEACCEQAWFILAAQPHRRDLAKAQGVRSVNLGGFSESFASGSRIPVCPEALAKLRQWVRFWATIR